MNRLGEEIATILTAIIGVAILAVLVSKNANTANVITSSGNAFSKALQTAISPVSGSAGIGYN
jgi:hypothetical protein